ncbi:hypothetical protein [Falsiroseomonas selenitidurans]|uniref:Uncharacterized protein n=1 Tax=Falsiroseomonas selenitidurans TaxID=2716335 RepID=A0ABX1E1Q2_9PROT|nr:hypothetical protein [Falsiroseomonas selenitidurans]NKC31031.1 hypothetical protein [Falsiroseomonas selenitidurans]
MISRLIFSAMMAISLAAEAQPSAGPAIPSANVAREAQACYDLHVGLARWAEAQYRACRIDREPPQLGIMRRHADVAEQRFQDLFGAAALAAAREQLSARLRRSVAVDPASCRQLAQAAPMTVEQQGAVEAELARQVPDWQRFAFRPSPRTMTCE